jgi:hypothetical protein
VKTDLAIVYNFISASLRATPNSDSFEAWVHIFLEPSFIRLLYAQACGVFECEWYINRWDLNERRILL